MKLCVDIPDRPGAIFEVMKVFGDEDLNVIAGYTNVLVYYERMSCEFVIDLRAASVKGKSDLEAVLKNKISALGPQFCLASLESIKL
jgi:hypothetical protein